MRGEKTGYNASIPSVQEEVSQEMDIYIPLPRHSGRIVDTRAHPKQTTNTQVSEPAHRMDSELASSISAQDTQTQVVLHRSGRIIRKPDRFMFLGESYDKVPDEQEMDPFNYNEALQDKDAEK